MIVNNCGNKVKHTCAGVQSEALCTKYRGEISAHSNLEEGSCLDVQEVIENLYNITEDLYNKIDISSLNNDCITFTEPRTLSSVMSQMYIKICQLDNLTQMQQTTITNMQAEIDDLQTQTCP